MTLQSNLTRFVSFHGESVITNWENFTSMPSPNIAELELVAQTSHIAKTVVLFKWIPSFFLNYSPFRISRDSTLQHFLSIATVNLNPPPPISLYKANVQWMMLNFPFSHFPLQNIGIMKFAQRMVLYKQMKWQT